MLDKNEISRQDAQNRVEEYWVGRLRSAVQDGDISRGSLMAGQSVGLVDRIMPVAKILGGLVRETEAELQRVREELTI
jgi:enoyl-[acyl-carrier protein] reductase II